MGAQIIDGKALAARVKDEIKRKVQELNAGGVYPGLAVILVGEDPASQIYVRNKHRACEELGIKSWQHHMPATTTQDELVDLVNSLNANPEVSGILVQLPLPPHLDAEAIIETIRPEKDVDGFHPINQGRLLAGLPGLVPCTPAGIMELIKESGVQVQGSECVVVGRSNIVGKPQALLLLQQHGTVTVCHSRTKNLGEVTKRADILVVAVGKARIITQEMVKPGAVVIDVGTNRLADGKLVGDVDFETVSQVAGAVTPVPGGVGPMTIAMLMKNTLEAARAQTGRK